VRLLQASAAKPVPVIARKQKYREKPGVLSEKLTEVLSVIAHVTNKEVCLEIKTHQNKWAVMGSRMTQEAATPMLMLTE
jgi:hypothetical protein